MKDIIKLGLPKEISQRVNNVSLSKSPSDSFNSRGLLDIGKEQDGYIKIGFETIERHEALLEQIIRKQFGENSLNVALWRDAFKEVDDDNAKKITGIDNIYWQIGWAKGEAEKASFLAQFAARAVKRAGFSRCEAVRSQPFL